MRLNLTLQVQLWLQPQQLPDQGVYLRNLVLQKLTHLAAATGHGFHR